MAQAPRRLSIADVLGFGSAPQRNLTQGYRQAVNRPATGTIKPDRKTFSRKIGEALTPNTRAGNEYANKIASLLDMITMTGAEEPLVQARGAAGRGDYGQAAGLGILAALGVIPGVGKVGGKVAREAAEAAAERGIIAYHGSPYSFDRFSLDKIGTGEGAQAYGHGLYFAEAEDVAQSYKQALEKVSSEPFKALGLSDRDILTAQALARQMHTSTPDIAARDFAAWTGRNVTPELINAFKTAKQPGSMYQVRINANPEDFLDWDKPLVEQPSNVRKAIASAFSGGDELAAELLGDLSSPEAMQIAGLLPKSKGSQVYNTLKFNQKPVGFDESGEPLFSGMAALENRNPIAATEAILRAGVPGIKYLDQGSRAAGEGSRNFVVFDDALIEILKKYGIAIPAIAGGGLLASQPQQDGGI